MKKWGLGLIILITMAVVFAEGGLSDIGSHWGKPYIEALVLKNSITGYPDGTFKPNGTIKIGEFVKILVSALGHAGLTNSTTGHWSEHYVTKAVELKLITSAERSGDCSNLNQTITRGQMARMISRAMTETFADLSDYEKQITDVLSIPADQKDPVVKMYRAGIITGYPDGTFKAKNTATRAEASTLLMRFLDKSLRQVPELTAGIWTDAQFEAFVNQNSEAKKFCSTRYFYVKDKKLVFKKGEAGLTADTTPSEANFVGLNALLYRSAKQLVWDAYQNGDYASIAYIVAFDMNRVSFNYYESQLMGEAMVHDGNFMLTVRITPTDPKDWPEMSGMTEKVKMTWKLRKFFGDEDDKLYTEAQMNALNYMLPKYADTFKRFVSAVYGTTDNEIYAYMFKQFQKGFEPAELKTIGNIQIKTLKDEGSVYRCYTSY